MVNWAPGLNFREVIRNKHERFLTVRLAPSLKKSSGNIVVQVNKKVTNLVCFLIFPGSSSILSSLMESWCNVLVENQSFVGHN